MVERYPKTYIITTAQVGVEPFGHFLDGLQRRLKEASRGEIVILPTNGRLTGKAAKDEKLDARLSDKNNFRIADRTLQLNSNISIVRDILVKAEAPYPLEKPCEVVDIGKSGIVGSPKIREKVYHDEHAEAHKIMVSTGALTHANYPLTEKGTIARLRHQYGALIVEVESKEKYHFRQLNADETGVFYDLGYRYDGRRAPRKEPLEALMLGDWHEGYNPPEVVSATERMIIELKPKVIIFQDLFDGDQVSNFHDEDNLYKSIQIEQGKNLLIPAFQACHGRILWACQIAPGAEILIDKSNHDERLTNYVKKSKYEKDDSNRSVGCRLFAEMKEHKQDPLEFGIKYYGRAIGGDIPPNVRFLQREDNIKICGWTVSVHGDRGGGKATTKSLSKRYSAIICGHSHSPEIDRNVVRAGTSTYLLADYTKGDPTNWMNSHVALPRNGHPQIINIIHGRYRPA
jgi:hypothetical protein